MQLKFCEKFLLVWFLLFGDNFDVWYFIFDQAKEDLKGKSFLNSNGKISLEFLSFIKQKRGREVESCFVATLLFKLRGIKEISPFSFFFLLQHKVKDWENLYGI